MRKSNSANLDLPAVNSHMLLIKKGGNCTVKANVPEQFKQGL